MEFNTRRVAQALGRSAKSLRAPNVWLCLLASVAMTAGLWLLFILPIALIAFCMIFLQPSPEYALFPQWFVSVADFFVEYWWIITPPFAYFLSMFNLVLVSVFILPGLLRKVAARQYPDLEKTGVGNFVVFSRYNLVAMCMATGAFCLILILIVLMVYGLSLFGFDKRLDTGLFVLLFPIAGLVHILPFIWFGCKIFVPNCLNIHASEAEKQKISRQHARPLLILGGMVISADYLLSCVPDLTGWFLGLTGWFPDLPESGWWWLMLADGISGLLLPGLLMLVYTHYCLEALRQLRGGALVSVMQGGEGAR
ncbi:MAG: hypothetical protein LBU53_01380 [Zoogloeaceae bacterium]|jgi:hypothetical protein|nr:hypothetical protein [Zoogloeaceae bacterium]